jgi:flavodoxin
VKTLVAFYSRTGTTKKIASAIAEKTGADLEEIRDTVDRSGAMGYLRSGRDSIKKKLTKLEPLKFEPDQYDSIIIGTPIWGWNVSVPVRTYITEQKDKFQPKADQPRADKKVAFFCTMGGSGNENAFSEMEKIIGKKPMATLALTTKEVVNDNYSEILEEFILKIKD